MRKLFYIIPLLFGMALSSCYDKEIDRINDRLDDMSDTMIASVSQQIASINNSILLLNNTDKELGEYIAALEAEAENLQTQITATNTKIDEVKTEVLSTISSEKANILAELEALRNITTARLEEINATIVELQAADGDMSAQISALEAEAVQLSAQLAETNTKIDTVKSELTETISTEKANILAELEAFKATVNGELDAIKAVLETLKAKDAELDGKIATLQEYVDTELKATEDWATATFATLEQYNEVVSTIATIEGTIEGINESIAALETRINEKIAKDIETACATLSADLQNAVKEITEAYTSAIATAKNELTEAYTTALEGAISALETSMKAWVNEQLAGYYTIAEMDAKLQVMQAALESKITASEDYLKGLISDLESAINEKVADNIKLIATLSASLSSLEGTLADRAQDIIANTQAIEENAKNIKENAEKILANGENIQANTTLIAENKTLIAQNEQLIKSNQSAIAALQNGVSANSQTIATNATNIATNASDIANNAAHIANNASAIADNLAAIATNATNLAKLQSELEATANEITEAYTNAIATAIATNNGEIEAKIATEIQKVNDKINALTQRVSALEQTVSNISTRLEDVESDIVDIQEQLTSLVNRIQSISYIPQYSDGKATIDTDKKIGVFDFHISPKSALSDLARVWHSALSVKAVHTQTRSTALIELPITYFKANTTEGTFSIQIDATNLGDDFFVGNREASVALHLSDGDNEYISSYINLALGVVEGFENAPANNEIWYTSTDGEIVTPCNTEAFGANIVSNTYKDGKGVITFDSDVTSIGDYAFYVCSSLESITIPDSVTSIGTEAFAYCSSLVSATIGKGVTSIGRYAFYGCTGELIVNCDIPSTSDSSYGSGAFYGSNFTKVTIGDGVTSIGEWSFFKCSSLASVTIGDSVTSIGDYAFSVCSSLASITIPDSVTSIGTEAFADCSSLVSATIGKGVTSIGRSAFYGCTGELIVNCDIPSASDSSYGSGAFYGSNFTKVTIGDGVTSIGDYAFNRCSSLASVTIGDSVTSIGDYAFIDCEALKQIVLPSNLKHIGICAFYGCSALEYITIPNKVTTIDGSAFAECDALTRVIIPESMESIGVAAFSRCDNLELFEGKFAADNGRCLIVNGQLVSVITGLTEYVILDGVTSLGPCVFDNRGKTSYLYAGDSYVQLTHVVIPNTVTEIGSYAFRHCLGLASITIPESVTEIGNQVFEGCLNLSRVKCLSTTPPTIGSNVFRKGLTICVPEESLQEYRTQWSDYAFYITTEKGLDPSNLDYLFYEGFDGNGVAQKNDGGWDTDMSSEKGQRFCSPLPEYQTAVTYRGKGTTVRSNLVSDNYSNSNYEGSGSNNIFFLPQSTLEVRGISLSELTGCALTLSFGGQRYHPDSNAFSFDEFKVYISEDNTKWSEVEYFFSEGTDLNNGRWNLATANFLLKEVPETISIRFDSSANGYRIDDIKLTIGEGGTEIDLSQGLILSNAEIEDDTIIDDTVIEIPENAEVWLLNKIDQTWVEDTHSTYGVGDAITIGNVKFGFYENTNPNDRSTALQNDHIRVFKDSAISISTIDGSKIKTVVFECLSNDKCVNLVVADGSVAVANTENLTISWTSTEGVDVFNAVASMGQVRLTKMYIVIDENTTE